MGCNEMEGVMMLLSSSSPYYRKLAQHLEHWGIDVMKMSKTDKSMAEMEVELNKEFAFDRITEAGKELDRVRGPGLVGLRNLGNSCYINSFLQLIFSGKSS